MRRRLEENGMQSAKNKEELLLFSMFLPGVSSRVFYAYVEEDEGRRLRLSGDYPSDRALDGRGGACLGDCAHLEDHEEETEGMEDLEVEITV